jgi:hypothetical protein
MNEPIEIETTPLFWDCECIEDYIHPKHETVCGRCHAQQEDSPDSRVSELAQLSTPKKLMAQATNLNLDELTPCCRNAAAIVLNEYLHQKAEESMGKARIQTTGSYCSKDKVFSIAICPVVDGPTTSLDNLTRADLDEIDSLIRALIDATETPDEQPK